VNPEQFPPGPKAQPDTADLASPTSGPTEKEPRITLEQVQVNWQKSWKFEAIEWLRAAAGLAAILGLFATVIYNSTQIAQLTASRDDERFDKAVTRLTSSNPTERLTGIVGLRLFLTPHYQSKHEAALLFLADAVAIEKEPTVRSAILHVFASLAQYDIDPQIKNHVLIVELERNRSILANLRSQSEAKLRENPTQLSMKEDDEIGLGNLTPESLETLQATATAIASLVRSGAFAQDFSMIYCVACVFSTNDRPVNLSNAKFDGSYLREAKFNRAILENASFHAADLIQTNFTGAILRKAKLTDGPFRNSPVYPPTKAIPAQERGTAASGPIFECADLTEADFRGAMLFGFYWTIPSLSTAYFPRFSGANLSHAKMESFAFYMAVPPTVEARSEEDPPGDVFPITSKVVSSRGVVEDQTKTQYRIVVYYVDKDFKFSEPISVYLSPSVYQALSSLNSAVNLGDADIPEGLRTFIQSNQRFLSSSNGSSHCAGFSSRGTP
jgi:uncharacterized protein YjbI with pentapeptide repeats